MKVRNVRPRRRMPLARLGAALCAPLCALALGSARPTVARAQSPAADRYVADGLREAYSQRQQAIDLALSGLRTREVRALSLPTVAMQHTGTRATGNIIDLGKFVIPAYGALNTLLGSPAFPTDVNVRLPLPSQTYVRVTQPLFAPQAWYGLAAASRAEEAQRFARDGAARQLAAEIRLAWLTWHKASSVHAVYDAAVRLLEEQVRISERLVAEGLRAPDAALRARAELSAAAQERLLAQQQATAAGRRLNHLVARPLESPVNGGGDLAALPLPDVEEALRAAAAGRDELRGLDAAQRAAAAQRRSATAAYLPTVALAFDYGYQGSATRFDGASRYTVLTLLAQWNLFNGDADRARAEQATLQGRSVATRREEAASLIELQVRTAHDAAVVAQAAIAAADDQLASTERAYTIVRRRYEEGLTVPIELLDARRAVTAAGISRAVAIADFHARRIEYLRAAALDRETTP